MDHSRHTEQTTAKDYFLFAAVLLGIFISSLILVKIFTAFSLTNFLRIFMGVFFLVFSIFKLLDLKGFVEAYIGYDVIAKRFKSYAYIYPFLELILALGYFLDLSVTNYFTVLLMAVSSIGVFKELMRGSKIKCACLGAFIKLPLTTISLTEDVVMGLMALGMIIFR
jgi:hypothetical protein